MSAISYYYEIEKNLGEDKYSSIYYYLLTSEKKFIDLFSSHENYINFNHWHYENIKLQNLKITDYNKFDEDSIYCNATIYKNGKPIADIIDRIDNDEIDKVYFYDKNLHLNDYLLKEGIYILMNDRYKDYLKLPKLSECSKLLKQLYDDVCCSDSMMCHITEDDWKDLYSDDFKNKDIEKLKKEIKKYGLEDVITINQDEYKICCYGDLQIKFNDDREFKIEKEIER